jgi:hypothetical protein
MDSPCGESPCDDSNQATLWDREPTGLSCLLSPTLEALQQRSQGDATYHAVRYESMEMLGLGRDRDLLSLHVQVRIPTFEDVG